MLVHYNLSFLIPKISSLFQSIVHNQICRNMSFKLKTLGKINKNTTRLVQILIFAQEN